MEKNAYPPHFSTSWAFLITKSLTQQGRLIKEELGEKLICFSENGNYLFQVWYIEVTSKIKAKHVPYMMGQH
jgi:hypothetical protein